MNQSSVHTKPATPPTHRDRFFLIRSPEFLFVYFSFFFFWCDRLAICEILRVFLWTGPKFQTTSPTRHQLQKQGGSRGRVQGLPHPPPPQMTFGSLIQLVFRKICRYVWYICILSSLHSVHIMLLPSQKPSSKSLLKFVYVTNQFCSSSVVHPR